MSKHTPGPWTIHDLDVDGDGRFWVKIYSGTPEDPNSMECVVNDIDVSDDAGKANARLIAAAPEMLELLRTAPTDELLEAAEQDPEGGAEVLAWDALVSELLFEIRAIT